MKSKIVLHFTLSVLLILALPIFAAAAADNFDVFPAATNPKLELPPAAEILTQVRSALPQEPVFIKGQMLSGGRIGKLEHAGYLEMLLEFGNDPATATYKISDAFGTPFERMTISVAEGCEPEFEYERGNPLRPATAPPPSGVIRDTDLTWRDLILLFLWRVDGRTVREEKLRGRDCYVIEFPGQAGAAIENRQSKISAAGGLARGEENSTTVWIDRPMMMLIQMEEIDREGNLQRRLTVKNIKKISDQWMIKNMEIRAYPSLRHTQIRIDVIVDGPQSTVNDK